MPEGRPVQHANYSQASSNAFDQPTVSQKMTSTPHNFINMLPMQVSDLHSLDSNHNMGMQLGNANKNHLYQDRRGSLSQIDKNNVISGQQLPTSPQSRMASRQFYQFGGPPSISELFKTTESYNQGRRPSLPPKPLQGHC